MFEPSDTPRVFGVPPGVDFPAALVRRLRQDFADQPPEALARVRLVVNTARMARRITRLFAEGPACLLPRIELVTDLPEARLLADIPPAVPPLRRRLEITQLVAGLMARAPDLAPRASLYDLSDSLAALMDEMHGEGVPPQTLYELDVSDHSEHWARSLKFLQIVEHYFDQAGEAPDTETRQRMVIDALARQWAEAPLGDPVILAGSTGSRGTTMRLMQAVARLPQGAIVLPGFDFDMPLAAWKDLNDALTAEDHPQYRFHALMRNLGITRADVMAWSDTPPPSASRNRLISLALRPAPVTDCWLAEGPQLGDLAPAFDDVTLLVAPSQRDEALAIALRLRQAAEEGQTAALITPDRMLTRQVTAALDRWGILPDDSAGLPLQLSAPGRFLRHVAALFHRKSDAAAIITLLKHPLTHTGSTRGDHLRWTRELELYLRRKGQPYPGPATLAAWAESRGDAGAAAWAGWVANCLTGQNVSGEHPLADHLARHIDLASRLAAGPDGEASGGLWAEKPGREALKAVTELQAEAGAGGPMTAADYAALFNAIMQRGEVRDRDAPHPRILIWGTLEARVQGADLLILGGLNEGSWPEMPAPDPWLNRKMRHDAGLLLPERRIGLSAHDFQQAVAAPEIWLTRAERSDDAQTVPSRWLNRLLNLSEGLPAQNGPAALRVAKERGQTWLDRIAALEAVEQVDPMPRPSPRPPVAARPRKLSVTEIKRLVRDPYAIYARHVLGLRPLDPLMRAPDALLRGIVTHEVLEQFVKGVVQDNTPLSTEAMLDKAGTILAEHVPWSDMRALWLARLQRVAGWFVATEEARLATARPVGFEIKASHTITTPAFTLTAKADRIDRDDSSALHIYDYKTGAVPSAKEQTAFDKQLLLEAAMAAEGAFEGLPPAEVARAMFIGLGSDAKEVAAPLDKNPPDQVWAEFVKLVSAYLEPDQGFSARRAMFKETDHSDYDQLARFGEWDTTHDPRPEDLS
ncbi:double-strand break repair protein AddB [Lutimaribacter sp. EGI FJ00015]|uniref:Double-strand break repair protein AddB n=1 Tax=Lutimaribacter degradans TaxID=2945989 RepID=A0ACC5ZUH1_9RHOB|nr:double-strand break repair protein AddB [Lutimaribacter sp. EGI FJ00013]MCM2561998.1 double-strand break repair protein AddB [Lutimaribacter sp. EGI FJ00013]MCO0612970.1 double-strand break repair protein AddB [Lutimaribacter sp. EGI FJ00015]MCO0635830.1 double-strand break repair protein AddB [Lutimaribacter sp. EGI FJ00014]